MNPFGKGSPERRKGSRARHSVLRQLATLETMTMAQLHEQWRDLYGGEPPRYKRQFLIKRLAYRIQELGARRAYRGRIALVNPAPSRRSFTRGCCTGTLPTPVTSCRGGWKPLRTTTLRHLDPNSSTERRFIDHLYQNGFRLPDAAQKRVQGIYCQPDFYYEPRVWVFCDGSPHDELPARERDDEQRQLIIARGDEVWSWHYSEDLAAKITQRPDIFRKVR